jgi:hypothetical protein
MFAMACWVVSLIGMLFTSMTSLMPPAKLVFAGKLVNSTTGEWPNDRLVLLYLNGREIGRDVSETGEFSKSRQGIHDGLFVIHAENPYRVLMSEFQLVDTDEMVPLHTRGLMFFPGDTMYYWFDSLEESSTIEFHVPSKNIRYVLKTIEGDIAALPPELLVDGSTQLKGNNQIIVSLQANPPQQAQNSSPDASRVSSITYTASSEVSQVNRMTIPINNCGGSAPIAQDYASSQTFIHEYRVEVGGGVGVQVQLPYVPVSLVAELQAKYGFEQGQIDTRQISYHMEALPGTNQVYVITWQEVWDSGVAQVNAGNDNITIPFRVKTNLVYQVDSTRLDCGSVTPSGSTP